jgi:hypothetical protein
MQPTKLTQSMLLLEKQNNRKEEEILSHSQSFIASLKTEDKLNFSLG